MNKRRDRPEIFRTRARNDCYCKPGDRSQALYLLQATTDIVAARSGYVFVISLRLPKSTDIYIYLLLSDKTVKKFLASNNFYFILVFIIFPQCSFIFGVKLMRLYDGHCLGRFYSENRG